MDNHNYFCIYCKSELILGSTQSREHAIPEKLMPKKLA